MDLGRLIRFINERETSVEDVRRYVARLRSQRPRRDRWLLGHGELGERERVLLSIAERAGAVSSRPGGLGGLLITSDRAGQSTRGAAGDQGRATTAAGRPTARSSAT